MRARVIAREVGGAGPRVALLPGLGARGTGFERLAAILSTRARVVIVDYAGGEAARAGVEGLAQAVAAEVGPVAGVVASSLGGMVAAHLAAAGACSGVAFLGSFTRLDQLGWRGRAFRAMGYAALGGRPGSVAAWLAAAQRVPSAEVASIVPTTPSERWSVWHRAHVVARERPPPALAGLPLRCVAIQGARDLLVPAATLGRLLAALPPSTPGHLLADAGHVPYWSHPWDVARLVSPWIERIEERLP